MLSLNISSPSADLLTFPRLGSQTTRFVHQAGSPCFRCLFLGSSECDLAETTLNTVRPTRQEFSTSPSPSSVLPSLLMSRTAEKRRCTVRGMPGSRAVVCSLSTHDTTSMLHSKGCLAHISGAAPPKSNSWVGHFRRATLTKSRPARSIVILGTVPRKQAE